MLQCSNVQCTFLDSQTLGARRLRTIDTMASKLRGQSVSDRQHNRESLWRGFPRAHRMTRMARSRDPPRLLGLGLPPIATPTVALVLRIIMQCAVSVSRFRVLRPPRRARTAHVVPLRPVQAGEVADQSENDLEKAGHDASRGWLLLFTCLLVAPGAGRFRS